MTIHATIHSFTDKTDKQVYNADKDFYFGADDDPRTKELRGSKNALGKPVIKALTKAEVIELAKEKDIEVDEEAKAPEVHDQVEKALKAKGE
jgi:hypothetical protein